LFETEVLTQEENLAGMAAINRELLARVEALESSRRVVFDLDSTEIPVYGQQEQSAYNGHFEATCYHPLLLFNGEGDCLAVKLRPGNAPVPSNGPPCSCRRSSGSSNRVKKWSCGPMRASPSRSCRRPAA
jgi:hypothetical protein